MIKAASEIKADFFLFIERELLKETYFYDTFCYILEEKETEPYLCVLNHNGKN